MTCEEVRTALGAHALGALDPQEAEEVDLHLATCEECGGELEELAGVAGFLGKVSERDIELVASPPRRVLERLLSERARRRRRGRVLMAVAAAAAVAVAGGVIWSPQGGVETTAAQESTSLSAQDAPEDALRPLAESADATPERGTTESAAPSAHSTAESDVPQPRMAEDDGTAQREAAPTPTPVAQGRAFDGADKSTGYRATVTAVPGDRRTALTVQVEGVPAGTESRLVIISRDGSRETSGPWTVTYEENTVFHHETTTPTSAITAFEITTDGKVLVRVPVTGR